MPRSSAKKKKNNYNTDGIEVIAGETGTLAILPTPTTTQTAVPGLPHSTSNRRKKIGAVIGGIVCGVLIVAAALGLFFWHARVKRRKVTRAAASVIFANRALPPWEKGAKSADGPHDVPLDAIRAT
jgi:hypothetical protein